MARTARLYIEAGTPGRTLLRDSAQAELIRRREKEAHQVIQAARGELEKHDREHAVCSELPGCLL